MRIKKCILNIFYLKYIFKFFLITIILFIIISNYYIENLIDRKLSMIKSNKNALNWNNIEKKFSLLANKYKYLIKKEKNIPNNSPIWIMWYQGIKNAPPIVLSCIKSILINRGYHHIHIIDKYNIDSYIKLPHFIKEKFNQGKFSITHLSDIVRMGLLYKLLD